MPNTDMVFRLFGFDVSAGTALDRVRLRAVETGGTLETLGRVGAMAFVAVGVAAATGAVAAIKMAADFERSMTMLSTQAQVPRSQIAGLSNDVLNLAGQVGFSPNSLANSLYFVESNMASFGIKPAQAMHMVRIAAEGAQIGMADLQDTTTALTATMSAYRNTGLTADAAMQILNATVGTGEMKFQDLNMALKTGVMATMQTYGVKLNEIGAALAVFGDNNLRGAAAGTALRMSVQAIAKPIQGGAEQLSKLGLTVTSLRDRMEKKGLTGALDLFRSKLIANHKPMSEWGAIFTTVFGKRAGIGLLELLKEFDRYSSKIPALSKATKGFASAWEQTQKTTAVQWDKMKSNFQALLIRIGNLLLPWVNNTVIPLFSKIITWVQAHLPQIQTAFQTIGKIGSAAFTAIGVALGVFKAILDPIVGTIQTFAAGVRANATVYLMFAAAVGASVAVILAFKAASLAVAAADGIAMAATRAWAGAMLLLDAVMDANPIMLVVIAIAAIAAILVVAWQRSETFRNIVLTVTRAVADYFLGMAGVIIHAAAFMLGWIPGVGPKLQQAAAAFDRFRDRVNAALAGVTRSINVGVYVGLSGPGVAMLHGLHTGQVASAIAKGSYLSGRAGGGPVTRGVPYMIGEQGREMFIPDQPGRIVPNSALGGYGGWGGSGGGISVTVNVKGTVGDDIHLAKTVVNAIRKAKLSGYRNLSLDLER